MIPLFCLDFPEDEMQSILICKPAVPSDWSTNQTKQEMLLDKDTNSHFFKPLNNDFSSGCSREIHSPYPSNYIIIFINEIDPLNNNSTSSGHSLSSAFSRYPSLTQQVESLRNNADFLSRLKSVMKQRSRNGMN